MPLDFYHPIIHTFNRSQQNMWYTSKFLNYQLFVNKRTQKGLLTFQCFASKRCDESLCLTTALRKSQQERKYVQTAGRELPARMLRYLGVENLSWLLMMIVMRPRMMMDERQTILGGPWQQKEQQSHGTKEPIVRSAIPIQSSLKKISTENQRKVIKKVFGVL